MAIQADRQVWDSRSHFCWRNRESTHFLAIGSRACFLFNFSGKKYQEFGIRSTNKQDPKMLLTDNRIILAQLKERRNFSGRKCKRDG